MATYKPLQSTVLTSATASVTFSGIDQTYTDLILVVTGIANAGAIEIQVGNGTVDTSSLYSRTYMYGDGSAASTQRNSGSDRLYVTNGLSNIGSSTIHLMNYSNTSTNKSILMRGSDAGAYTTVTAGLWRSTSAINTVKVSGYSGGDLSAGTTLDLYGIKSGAPQALGGDVVTTDGNYWYHAFRSTSAFIPQRNLTADVLIVAGGGGAGGGIAQNYSGSGGGAGGLRAFTSQSLSPIGYTVTVGAGGAGALATQSGVQGSNTTFNSLSVTGGGYGSNGGVGLWGNGGSGGGATADGGVGSSLGAAGGTGNAGSYSPVEGYAGGRGWYGGSGNIVPSGGGGGAGGAGGDATVGGAGGAGGAGTNTYNSINFSSWLSATATGVSSLIAGGGGGGARSGSGAAAGAGGSGGGAAGAVAVSSSVSTAGNNATANTGGGGGGGGPATSGTDNKVGGNGASGLVIVRYPV